MPDEEPIDENISTNPPTEFDRDEGDFNPGATGSQEWEEEDDREQTDEDED